MATAQHDDEAALVAYQRALRGGFEDTRVRDAVQLLERRLAERRRKAARRER